MRAMWMAMVCVAVIGGNVWAATPAERAEKHAEAVEAGKAGRDIGGALPLPINVDIKKSNSAQDLLRVQVTYSKNEKGTNVAYARVVWGDLDNLIKGGGKQYYSNWDGYLEVTGATAEVVHKIQFDDGGKTKLVPHVPSAGKTHSGEPGSGSGRDELLTASGPKVEWKAGVVGGLDGLRIKMTSATPSFSGTIKAGSFTIPFTVVAEPAAGATVVHPSK